MLHSNQKLTKIIAGRTISSTANQDGKTLITFDDGSILSIKTAPASSNSATTGGKVLKVRQADTTLALDFEGGTTLEIALAEATSSVMLRDKAGVMEYAD